MAKKRVTVPTNDYAELRRIIYGAMAEQNFRWADVVMRMTEPMCAATLATKCKNPAKMTLAELRDITVALGVSDAEVRAAI